MLATFRQATTPIHGYSPAIPSPLSPRSANIYGSWRTPTYLMSKEGRNQQENITPAADAGAYSRRPIKKAPSPKQDELKERRKKNFLKKVQEGRNDKRFEARAEDIMRMDFMQQQRAWEAAREREAPLPDEALLEHDEEDFGLPSSSDVMQLSGQSTQIPGAAAVDVDDVVQMEDAELEALLSYMEADDRASDRIHEAEPHSDHLWSDDDDYDALFSELVKGEMVDQAHFSGQPSDGTADPSSSLPTGDAMDMS